MLGYGGMCRMKSHVERSLTPASSKPDRPGSGASSHAMEARDKARAIIKAAREALADGRTVDLVQINAAYEALYSQR